MIPIIFTVLLFITTGLSLLSVFFFNGQYIMPLMFMSLGLVSFLGLLDKTGTGQ
jgi:hypothetical protein